MKGILTTLAVLAVALAGCTGDFNVRQTEPIRIQIDGEGEDTRIASSGCCPDQGAASERSEFHIDADDDAEKILVVVKVMNVQTSNEPATMTTTATQTTTQTANQTTTQTQPGGDDEGSEKCVVLVIVQDRNTGQKLAEERVDASSSSATAELDVDVRGNNNLVVITEAVDGIADVNVAARGSSADEGGSTASASATTTASSPTNATYGP